jgi:putative membrane protein
MRVRLLLVALVAVALVVSLIDAPYPSDQALQHVPTVIALALLAWSTRRAALSTPSTACLVAFLGVHILGARYVYTMVPYERWLRELFGFSAGEAFGFRRNHYDRLAHFAYGLLLVLPVNEVLARRTGLSAPWRLALGSALILATSGLYEVFEWALTMRVAPDRAERYNGQQGDLWDAQKDMALAALGALAGSAWVALRRPRSIAAGAGRVE